MDDGQGEAGTVTWKVVLTPTAEAMLLAVKDLWERRKIAEVIDGLARDPNQQGKALAGELADYRSIRAAGQPFRVIYRADAGEVLVIVIAVARRQEGSRRDVYRLAERLVRLAAAAPSDQEAEAHGDNVGEEERSPEE